MRFFMDGDGRCPHAGWSWRSTALVAGLALLSSLAVGIGAAGGLSVLDESGDQATPVPAESEAKARVQVPLPLEPPPPPDDGNTAEASEPLTQVDTEAPESDAVAPPEKPPVEAASDVAEESEPVEPESVAVEESAESATSSLEGAVPEAHRPQVGDELPSLRDWGDGWGRLDLDGVLPNGSGGDCRGPVSGWGERGAAPGGSGAAESGSVPEGSGRGEGDSGAAAGYRSRDGHSPSWDTGYPGHDRYERLSHRPCDPYRRNCRPMITPP